MTTTPTPAGPDAAPPTARYEPCHICHDPVNVLARHAAVDLRWETQDPDGKVTPLDGEGAVFCDDCAPTSLMLTQSLRTAVTAAVAAELDSAQEKCPPFNSPHEGWAVILEELEELDEEAADVRGLMQRMFRAVRANDVGASRECATGIARAAERLVVEGVQVAAMALRYLDDIPAAHQTRPGRVE